MRVSTPRLPPLERQPFVLGSRVVLSSSGDRTHGFGDPLCQHVLFTLIHPKSFLLLGVLAALPAGQALADTKSAVQFESVTCQENPSSSSQNSGLVSIMTTDLANSQAASYLVNASLVTGLLTNTTVTSNGGGKSSGSATGSVQVGVMPHTRSSSFCPTWV